MLFAQDQVRRRKEHRRTQDQVLWLLSLVEQ